MLALVGAIDLGGDGDFDPGRFEDIDHPLLSIIGAIGEQRAKSADNLR
jgi:hypothetical protein